MATLNRNAVAAAAAIALALPLHASSPKFFQAATQAEFLSGDVENLSIDSRGELSLGPATELVYESAAPFLWTVSAQPDGTIFAGSGNEGRVFRIDAQGKGSVFFDSAELEVHALAPAPDGGLYVGTSPDGRIYKIDRDGAARPFFDDESKYIWSLAVDARGNLFAGTGDKGIVYRIAPDGTGAPFYKTNATHVTALAFDARGNLFAGTGTPGRVLRIDAEGKPFVVLDSPFQEIRALRFDDRGTLYVAALNGRGSSSGSPAPTEPAERQSPETARAPVPSVSAEITSVTVVDVGGSSGGAAPAEDRRSVKGAVYRVAPDGTWDQLWESRDDAPYALAFDAAGALLVGTGNKGKIYRLEGEPLRPTLLARASGQQITSFLSDPKGRLLYSTANPGKIFRLGTERAGRGAYESEVHDAQMQSAWGSIRWRGTTPEGARVEVFTRSGNTETPDDTWSAWSTAYTSADGSAITSPGARYLQWRAILNGGKGGAPVITSITAAYLQRNVRPHVRSITVHPPGIVFQKPFSTGDPELAGFDDQSTPDRRLAAQAAAQSGASSSPPLGRRTYQKGLQTLVWRADDENEDDLTYDVEYRREGERSWKTLRKGLTDSILVWDTTTVPNGTYFVKIVASDASGNAAGNALTGELGSVAFEVDNTPPTFAIATIRVDRGRTIVAFDVTDDHSPIQRVEYSQDGTRWRALFPVDGIADSRAEHYELTIDGELTERGVTLRATDAMNNVASAQVDAPSSRR